MEEPYTEGVATHGGPEPCVGDPRGRSEALDRGTHRPAIEPRNGVNRGADVVMTGGRQHRWRRYARVASGPREVGEPVHVRNLHAREPGDPTIALPPGTVRAARGRLRPHARDARLWEVGLPHSTGEAVEQGAVWLRRWWREGGSARGTRPAQHAPDTEPGQVCQVRWTVCVGSGLMRTGVGPERGAQCGSSARWDPCGGPPGRVGGAHCCAPPPSGPCMPLVAAHGPSKPRGRFRWLVAARCLRSPPGCVCRCGCRWRVRGVFGHRAACWVRCGGPGGPP